MDNIYRVYCINLRRRHDRLENFLASFPKAWLSKLSIHGAVDGQNYTLTSEDRARLRIDMSPNKWGCSFSHEAVWRDLVKNEYKYVIILEDDAVYNGTTTEAMDTFMTAFIQSTATLCLLGSENKLSEPHNFTDIVTPSICSVSSNLGSMSYVITLQGAKDLLTVVDTKGHYQTVDHVINNYMKQRNTWICSAPPLFKVNSGADTPTLQIFIIFHKYIIEDCYNIIQVFYVCGG